MHANGILSGINSFGGKADLSNVSVAGSGGDGGDQFIVTPLKTTLQNPSNVTLNTVNIALPVTFNGVGIGRAVIDVRVVTNGFTVKHD